MKRDIELNVNYESKERTFRRNEFIFMIKGNRAAESQSYLSHI